MKGVILAAGMGSRLYPITRHIPKPLLPLANRPTIHYAFDQLKELGIREICIVAGQNESQMRAALGDGRPQGVELAYVRQTEPKGLAHALGFARDFCADDPFVLYLGDAIYGGDFVAQSRRFLDSGCANLNIVQEVEDPRRYGVAEVEGDRIVRLVEKPQNPKSNLAMAGTYFFRKAIWSVLPDLPPSARGEYEITDAIQCLVDRGETVLAAKYQGVWFDTGTLDSFLATSAFLLEGASELATGANVQGEVGNNVAVGPGASVECESIQDCVVLAGSEVQVEGAIRHCVLGGSVESPVAMSGELAYGDERK